MEFQIFPKFKKVQNFLGEGGGGQENCGLFPLFVTFLNWNASLRVCISFLKRTECFIVSKAFDISITQERSLNHLI